MAQGLTSRRSELADRIQRALDGSPEQPWCVHRLYEEIIAPQGYDDRSVGLDVTRHASELLVETGRAKFEQVSATSIGVHCEDALYWSTHSPRLRLAEFGPQYESPTMLRRLASHFQCHGL